MPSLDPIIAAFLNRLVTVKEYADLEGISVVQAHRRIAQGKAQEVIIKARHFIVLPEDKAV
jgi:hypothetical protein